MRPNFNWLKNSKPSHKEHFRNKQQLGYQYSYIYTSANGSLSGFIGINNYINSGNIVLQMGYYVVQAYCLHTLTSSTSYFTTLGMNTKQS